MIPISKPAIGAEETQAVLDVLASGMLVQGVRTAELEARWAAACGTQYAVATSSGTTALHLALLGHGIGPGDEVITSPFTFIASVNSIVYVGATPVLVDVDPQTFNIDPEQIEAAITPRTRAIMPVHLYGLPCDMDRIGAIAARHGLLVIEDAAQAIAAEYKGRRAGSFGTGCFSLYATKNVMSGEGGMITTDDPALAEHLRLLRSHGSARRYYHDILGYNFRLTDLQAALGVVQIGRLAELTEQRRANAAYMSAHIRNPRVITPEVAPGYGHVWHQYTIRVVDPAGDSTGAARDRALAQLSAAGVGTGVFYPLPAHKQEHLRHLGLDRLHFPVSERLALEVVSIPVHPLLSPADLDTIVQAVNAL